MVQGLDNSKGHRRGFEVLLDKPKRVGNLKSGVRLSVRLSHHWPEDAIQVKTKKRFVVTKTATHVTITYDGSSKASGLKVYIDGKLEEVEITHDALTGSIRTGQTARDRK